MTASYPERLYITFNESGTDFRFLDLTCVMCEKQERTARKEDDSECAACCVAERTSRKTAFAVDNLLSVKHGTLIIGRESRCSQLR